MALLDDVKGFARIDGEESDPILADLIETAQAYITQTTGVKYQGSKLEDLCVKLLVKAWFDNEEVPPGVVCLLQNIEYK